MLKDTPAFSSFSVNDLDVAKVFYGNTLGLDVEQGPQGLTIHLEHGGDVFVYPKGEMHEPASFTVLNFSVEDIDQAVDELIANGIELEHYDDMPVSDEPDAHTVQTDSKGIMRSSSPDDGPSIAWFKDPSGNILSVLSGSVE